MNKYYDLIVRLEWFAQPYECRREIDDRLREWFAEQNAKQQHSVAVSNQHWVNSSQFTQKMRCRTEYQAFEARLMFGEIFTTVVITEQEEGIYKFK